jgi:hypothetical protein
MENTAPPCSTDQAHVPGGLQFDEDRHAYSVDGEPYDGVTQILSKVLRCESPWWQPSHRLRGVMVHRILEAVVDRDYDESAVQVPPGWTAKDREEIVGRGRAIERFVDETGFQPIASELRVFLPALRVGGTIDTLGRFSKGRFKGQFGIVDAKSGTPTPAAILQLSLYDLCLKVCRPDLPAVTARVVLHVRPNGTPRPTYRTGYELLNDDENALAVLKTFHFMKENNLL